MEDMILREMRIFRERLLKLLQQTGILKIKGMNKEAETVAKTELLEHFDIDLDELLNEADVGAVLTNKLGTDFETRELFAELLFDLAVVSDNKREQALLSDAVFSIYRRLDSEKAPLSIKRTYIVEDLEQIRR